MRLLRQLGWALLGTCFVAGWIAGAAEASKPEEDIFQTPRLFRLSLTLSPKASEQLEAGRVNDEGAKPKARATVREGERTYRDVEVQLKGFTTFQPLDGTPSLTLDFDQFVPGQNFHGLTKLSLNNSLQDPTRLHERLAREVFADAGVPVPRATHALVTLNGRELGLYVLAEGYDKTFLKRHFADADGNFYEGGTLQDITRPLQFKSGKRPDDRSDVDRLVRAAREPDPARRFAALAQVLDLERYFSMVAIEAMLCHSDSYSMNRNNYRLYHDPTSDRIVFLPHGMDRILGTHRSNLDLPVVPPAMGLVTRALLSTPEGRQRYVERAEVIFTNLFTVERLCARVRETDEKIRRERTRAPGDRQSWGGAERAPEEDGADLCRRIERRIADLKLQFAARSNLLAITPPAVFDTNGVTPLLGWRIRPVRNSSSAEITEIERDGRVQVRIRSTAGALQVALYSRVLLPAGSYRLTGGLPLTGASSSNAPLSLLRYHSSDRFTTERQKLGNRNVDLVFSAGASLPEEEFEFICEVRGGTNEVWLDPSALRLVRTDLATRARRRRAVPVESQ